MQASPDLLHILFASDRFMDGVVVVFGGVTLHFIRRLLSRMDANEVRIKDVEAKLGDMVEVEEVERFIARQLTPLKDDVREQRADVTEIRNMLIKLVANGRLGEG